MQRSDRSSRNTPSDIRFDKRRKARIEHHSAKGKVVRNVGSFTRGTQLGMLALPLFGHISPGSVIGRRYAIGD